MLKAEFGCVVKESAPSASGAKTLFQWAYNAAKSPEAWWDVVKLVAGEHSESSCLAQLESATFTPAGCSFKQHFVSQWMQECSLETPLTKPARSLVAVDSDLQALLQFLQQDTLLKQVFVWAQSHCGTDPSHDIHHFLRVALRALECAKGSDLNHHHVLAAALLHDIVALEKKPPPSPNKRALCRPSGP